MLYLVLVCMVSGIRVVFGAHVVLGVRVFGTRVVFGARVVFCSRYRVVIGARACDVFCASVCFVLRVRVSFGVRNKLDFLDCIMCVIHRDRGQRMINYISISFYCNSNL